MPTNFKHLTHVGWSAQKGFDLTGDDVETLKPFLEKAGVSDQQVFIKIIFSIFFFFEN